MSVPSDDEHVELAVKAYGLDIEVKAKSRAVSAFDRLVGNIIDGSTSWFNRYVAREKAAAEGEYLIIKAASEYAAGQVAHDREFADRVVANHFGKLARQQLNKEAVAAEAVVALQNREQSVGGETSSDETLSVEFIDRFEPLAEAASTEELRQKWGRVLAAEVLKPGTFNAKVLRITDELDSETARLFEEFVKFRITGRAVARVLSSDLDLPARIKLISAGLLHDPGANGQIQPFSQILAGNGKQYLSLYVNNYSFSFPSDAAIDPSENVIVKSANAVGLRCFVLTDEGAALASILDYNARAMFAALVETFETVVPLDEMVLFSTQSGDKLKVISKDQI